MNVILGGAENQIITSYFHALKPCHQVRVVSSLADIGEISEKDLLLVVYRDLGEMERDREKLLELAKESLGVVAMLPHPWEVSGEYWAQWIRHKFFMSEPVPADRLQAFLEYACLWLQNMGHYNFLTKVFFVLLSLKIRVERTGVKDALFGIFGSILTELKAKRGMLLGCRDDDRLELVAFDGFEVEEEVLRSFVDAFQSHESFQKGEIRNFFILLLKSLGYSCREGEINIYPMMFQNQRLGWILMHGCLDSAAQEMMATVSFCLGAFMYMGQLEERVREETTAKT